MCNRQKEISRLLAISKHFYADRQVSRGYWAASRAALLIRHPQYHTAIIHDLRGTPPTGVIWIRPSSGGKWGKSRQEKFGAPDTTLPAGRTRAKPAAAPPALAERLTTFKIARRIAALQAARIESHRGRGTDSMDDGWWVSGKEYPLYTTNGWTHRIMMTASEPCSCGAFLPTALPPTIEEAKIALAKRSADNLAESIQLRDRRLEQEARKNAEYESAVVLPTDRITFDMEGGFSAN
jgi:hypothetical protein